MQQHPASILHLMFSSVSLLRAAVHLKPILREETAAGELQQSENNKSFFKKETRMNEIKPNQTK